VLEVQEGFGCGICRVAGMARRAAKKRPAAKQSKAKKAVKKTPARKKAAKAKAPARPVRTAVKGALAQAVAVVTKRLPGDPDAIALLEADHRRLEDLLKQGEETTERAVKGRRELLKTITSELKVHELIEEKILYPALKAHPEGRDIVLEGFEEHHVADLIVKELRAMKVSTEQWGAKFKVLKENIEHHIKEEEGPMFRTARGVFSREELQVMGATMKKMKARA
jgi:hemerythrin-like domain-containing protein